MSGGRPAIKRSGTKAALVEAMAQYGVPQDEIAAKIGMSVDTMVKLYKQELITGRTNANVKVGKRLFDKAMSGDTTALIFWAKTRMGWREIQKIDLSSSDRTMSPAPALDLSHLSSDELLKLTREAFKENERNDG
jgi:hypothetical protein